MSFGVSAMKFFSILYNSLLWALVISLTCFKSEWLEMRVNIGLILFVLWPVLFAAVMVARRKSAKFGFSFSAINLAVCLTYALLLYGVQRLAVVPASMIREGLHLSRLSFSSINIVLGVFLLSGIGLLLAEKLKKKATEKV